MNFAKKLLSLLLVFNVTICNDNEIYRELFENKKILITGGTGFIGRALIKRILAFNPRKIVMFSRDEVKHYKCLRKFNDPRLVSVLGDVREYRAIKRATQEMDIVIHAAALKRLDTIESNICESIHTNIIGTENVARACLANQVEKATFISSDKACLPANAYGACKYVSEKIFTNHAAGTGRTKFTVVRYGNVLESTGSVIPFFCSRIAQNLTIPLTDERMTRFFITKDQASDLIFKSLFYGQGGEIFVPSLPAFTILSLIEVLQEMIGNECPIEIIGIRPGEKIHELMINETEIPRAYKLENIFVIAPTIPISGTLGIYKKFGNSIDSSEFSSYSSGNSLLSKNELKTLLEKQKIVKRQLMQLKKTELS